MNHDKGHPHFFITLIVNDFFLHNFMLDSSFYNNVMSLKVMNQLTLEITWPYWNVCGIDSREIKVLGIIKDLQVDLENHPSISLSVDVVVIGIPDSWDILLSRKWSRNLGGSIQMVLNRETTMRLQVEYFCNPINKLSYTYEEFGNLYAI